MAAELTGSSLTFGGGKLIKIVDVMINTTLTFDNDGCVNISSYLPPAIPGYARIIAMIKTWSTGTVYNVTSEGLYLFGEPNKTVTKPTIRYFYLNQGIYEVI